VTMTIRKLSDKQVRAIRKSNLPYSVLAERYGLSKSSIKLIRTRRRYKDVTDDEEAGPQAT
jgi:hypothetical protein